MIRFQDKELNDHFNLVFLKSLQCIADKKKQNESWINGNYKGFNTYIEVFERFTSPCEYVMKWPSLPKKYRLALQELYQKLMNYKDYYEVDGRKIPKADKEIAQDPEWHQIRIFAEKIYNELTT